MMLELVNVVGGGEFREKIDIVQLHEMLSLEIHSEYEPDFSAGLRLQLPESESTALLFASGNFHITGAKSENNLKRSADELAEILADTLAEFDKVLRTNVELRNLVFVGELGQEIDLDKLSQDLERSNYDPANFPGLQYRRNNQVMTIYRSGKFTVTGCKCRQSAEDVANTVRELLSSE